MYFRPGTSGLKKLDNFARGWDEYVVKKAELRYTTSSPTTATGHVMMGVDYSATKTATTQQDVAALDPRVDGPIWQNLWASVDHTRAMSKSKMYTNVSDANNTAFAASVYTDVANSGLVWCHYTVEFMSPSSDLTTDVGATYSDATVAIVDQGGNNPGLSGEPVVSHQADLADGASVRASTSTVEYRTQIRSVVVGQNLALTGSGLKSPIVTFLDADTGAPLPDGTIVPVKNLVAGPNGIWSALWTIAKPIVKSIIMYVADNVLGTNGAVGIWKATVTQNPDSTFTVSPYVNDMYAHAHMAGYIGASGQVDLNHLKSLNNNLSWGPTSGQVVGPGSSGIPLTVTTATIPKGSTIMISQSNDTPSGTTSTSPNFSKGRADDNTAVVLSSTGGDIRWVVTLLTLGSDAPAGSLLGYFSPTSSGTYATDTVLCGVARILGTGLNKSGVGSYL